MVIDNWTGNLKRQTASLIPLVSGIVLVLLTSTPLYFGHVGDVAPRLAVTAVIFWTVYRPDLFGYGSAFVLGLAAELIAGLPLGITALVLVIVRHGVLSRRRYFLRKSFHVVWAEYALVVVAAVAIDWMLGSLYLWTVPGVVPHIIQVLLTVVMFPAVYWLLARCQGLVFLAGPEVAGAS